MTTPTPSTPFRIAAVQATSVFLDRQATVSKACALIEEAAGQEARLVAFPESFIPAYPDWVWAVPAGEVAVHDELYAEMVANAVDIPGPVTEQLGEVARRTKTYLVMGLTERNQEASGGSLYNTLIYIDSEGRLLGKHRKLVPTSAERMIWAHGDGSTIHVYDTPMGRLSGLICWENYMPLARYALYAWGTQIYVAATWDRGEPWLSTMRHIAREGSLWVLGCGMPLRPADIPERLGLRPFYNLSDEEWINTGDSVIVAPNGEIVAGPLQEQEGILYADVDPKRLPRAKRMLDVAGHYARPDVFNLTIQRGEHPLIQAVDPAEEPPHAKAPLHAEAPPPAAPQTDPSPPTFPR